MTSQTCDQVFLPYFEVVKNYEIVLVGFWPVLQKLPYWTTESIKPRPRSCFGFKLIDLSDIIPS